MKIGRLLLRIVVGGFFVGHGTQKLFGWFGGDGLKATASGFEQMGLRPGRVHASAAGLAEAGGGALLLTGLQTPLAAAAITATMLTAIRTVHVKNGPWVTDGGYEYNVVLVAAVLALAELGPGPVSLDGLRGRERAGARWALAALAAGGAGAAGVYLSQRQTSQQAPADAARSAPQSLGEEAENAAAPARAEQEPSASAEQAVAVEG
jgi:putative oxidoreductase